MLKDLILKNRSYRRFYQGKEISLETLKELIDLARYSASAANLQSLRFMLCNAEEDNNKIFSCLSWAGYLKDWDGPIEGEKPSAYIVLLTNKKGKYILADAGIAAQSILLGAVEKGFGGCMFGSVKRDKFRELFHIPQDYDIPLIIALGKPREKIIIEDIKTNLKYWRDKDGVHHVPKMKLDDLIIKF